ncbi:hypothetical protein LCGC14_1068610 [marine sediment metagenome]|uniref:Uncharacterized protein n=1 Tax=marine sediment metagenome TaxID=412755 RepID=A0A0F9QPU4_9ZZZZ
MEAIQFGEPVKSLDAATPSNALNGTAYAVPSNNVGFAWSTGFLVAVDAIDVALQISMDNSVWTDLDSSTVITGEARYKDGSAKFVRGRVETVTIGSGEEITLTIALIGAGGGGG